MGIQPGWWTKVTLAVLEILVYLSLLEIFVKLIRVSVLLVTKNRKNAAKDSDSTGKSKTNSANTESQTSGNGKPASSPLGKKAESRFVLPLPAVTIGEFDEKTVKAMGIKMEEFLNSGRLDTKGIVGSNLEDFKRLSKKQM